jgi:hypothetical protein
MKKKRNHFLFGMVSQFLPLRAFGSNNQNSNVYNNQYNNDQFNQNKKITISRNFSAGGDGQSLLNQNFDRKILDRNTGAPIRSSINPRNNIENLPQSL